MAAQPLAGAVAVRAGSRPVTVAGGVVYIAALPLIGLAPSVALFVAASWSPPSAAAEWT